MNALHTAVPRRYGPNFDVSCPTIGNPVAAYISAGRWDSIGR
jgi:hypothetical protein